MGAKELLLLLFGALWPGASMTWLAGPPVDSCYDQQKAIVFIGKAFHLPFRRGYCHWLRVCIRGVAQNSGKQTQHTGAPKI